MVTRFLTPEEIGVYAFANIFYVTLRVVVSGAFIDTLVQKDELDNSFLNTAFLCLICIFSVLFIFVFLIGILLKFFFVMPNISCVLVLLSLNFVFICLNIIPESLFLKSLDFRKLAVKKLGEQFFGGFVGIVCAISGFGVFSLVAQVFAGNCAGFLYIQRFTNYKPRISFDYKLFLPTLFFFRNRAASYALSGFSQRIDLFFVGSLLGPLYLGYYALASRICAFVSVFTNLAFVRYAYPVFIANKNSIAKMRELYLFYAQCATTLGAFGFFGLIFLSKPIVLLFFGQQWSASIRILKLLSIAGLLTNSIFVPCILLRSIGKANLEFRCILIPFVLNIIVLGKSTSLGLIFVALTLISSLLISLPFVFCYTHKETEIGLYEFIKPVFISWVCGFLSFTLSHILLFFVLQYLNIGLSLQIVYGICLYSLTFLFFLFVLNRKFIFRFFNSFLNYI